jgi:hypothetical protein
VTHQLIIVLAVAAFGTAIAVLGIVMSIRQAMITDRGLHSIMSVTRSGPACPCPRCTAARAAPVPATAAHPPNPVPTSGCACAACTKARTGVGGSNTLHFSGGNSGSGGGGGGAGGGAGGVVITGGTRIVAGGSGGGGNSSSGGSGGGGNSSSGGGGGSPVPGSSGSPSPAPTLPGKNAPVPGSDIMRRITPRPAHHRGVAGMEGFTEQGSGEFDLAIGTVRGLRQWSLATPDLNSDPARTGWMPQPMKGATGAFRWQNGVNEASCNKDKSHQPPVDVDKNGRACGCGFWAYWTIGYLASGGAMKVDTSTALPITGLIEGTGRTLVGERGFRCQRARIVALAPAFSVQTDSPPDYGDVYRRHLPRSRVVTGSGQAHPGRNATEREIYEAQQRADAWMGIIQDRLQLMYPDSKVYATLRGMLACVTTGEIA